MLLPKRELMIEYTHMSIYLHRPTATNVSNAEPSETLRVSLNEATDNKLAPTTRLAFKNYLILEECCRGVRAIVIGRAAPLQD